MKNSIQIKFTACTATCLLLLLSFRSATAAPGEVDPSFDAGSGLDSVVHAVVPLPDGKLLVGGSFRTVRGLKRTGIARLNADGSGDPGFDPGTGAYEVYAVALQPDGKVLIGGAFVSVNGAEHLRVARLNVDGSLDAAFNAGVQSGAVYSMAAMADGRVFIGGTFTSVNGISRGGVALLDAQGNLDTSFNPGPVFYALNTIRATPDGKVYIAGIAPPVWRLDANGSRDLTFDPDWRAMGQGFSLATQPDGKVLVGSSPVSTSPNGLLRLNLDGSPDSTFQPATGAGSEIQSVAVQPDGKLLVAGSFTTAKDAIPTGIARLHADGSLDTGFHCQVHPVYPYEPIDVTTQSDGKIIICGAFLRVNGTVCRRVARLNSDGSLDHTFDPGTGVTGLVNSLVRQPDGGLVAGGRGIDRLFPDGSRDTSFNGEWTPSYSSYAFLSSLGLQPDGNVILGAGYGRLLRVHPNGSLDSSLQPLQEDLTGPSALINTVAVQHDGSIFIAGNFDSINGSTRHNVGRLHADGSLHTGFLREDDEWDGGTYSAMVVQPDGKVVVGGRYFEVNAGALAGYVRRFHANGDVDNGFTRLVGVPGSAVRSFALQPDGKLIVGGSVEARGSILRLNADGTVDAGFDSLAGPNGPVLAIALQADGKILIGGDFTSFNTAACNRIARLNANGSLDTAFNHDGADGRVSSILVLPDGNIVIGGEFLMVGNLLRPFVARLYGTPLPALTITQSGAFAVLSWPSGRGNYQLHQSADLSLPGSWAPVAGTPLVIGDQSTVSVPMTTARQYFRLHSSP